MLGARWSCGRGHASLELTSEHGERRTRSHRIGCVSHVSLLAVSPRAPKRAVENFNESAVRISEQHVILVQAGCRTSSAKSVPLLRRRFRGFTGLNTQSYRQASSTRPGLRRVDIEPTVDLEHSQPQPNAGSVPRERRIRHRFSDLQGRNRVSTDPRLFPRTKRFAVVNVGT